jgi:hypothetical protein
MRIVPPIVAATLALCGCGDDATAPQTPAACATRPALGPAPRGETAGVLDQRRQRIVMYGGNTALPEQCMPRDTTVGDTWAFQLDCNSWEQLGITGAPSPGPRAGHAAVLDGRRDRMIVFGGHRSGPAGREALADLWAFDLGSATWQPLAASGTAPTPRSGASLVYDETGDRLLLFGGDTGDATSSDELFLFELATSTWLPVPAGEAPAPRAHHGAALLGRTLIVHGGSTGATGTALDDLHAFDLDQLGWRPLPSSGIQQPGPRADHQLVADPLRNRVLRFAGRDLSAPGKTNDVWAFDPTTARWSQLRPGDTLQAQPTGPCSFPPGFTLPEAGSPERRQAFLAVADPTGAYLLTGQTDCGNIDDVWRFDLAIHAWRPLRPASAGESCSRGGRTDCTDLCM